MTARERWEQTLRDAWRASIDLDDMTDSENYLVYQIGKALSREAKAEIVDELLAESDRVSRSQPSTQVVVGTVEAQDRETEL